MKSPGVLENPFAVTPADGDAGAVIDADFEEISSDETGSEVALRPELRGVVIDDEPTTLPSAEAPLAIGFDGDLEPKLPEIDEKDILKEPEFSETFERSVSEAADNDLYSQIRLEQLSSSGNSWARSAFNKIRNLPVVAKMETGVNQFFANTIGDYNDRITAKFSGVDIQAAALEKGIATMREQHARMLVANPAAAENMLHDINRQQQRLDSKQAKRERLKTKIENRKQIIGRFETQRNHVAERLMSKYEQKANPLESSIANLESYKEEIETRALAVEIDLRDEMENIKSIESDRDSLQEQLRHAGYSERKIRQATRTLDQQISKGLNNINVTRATIARELESINNSITTATNKARPHQQRIAEFAAIRDRETMQVDLDSVQVTAAANDNEKLHFSEDLAGFEYTEADETPEKATIKDLINTWNKYLTDERSIDNQKDEYIDLSRFLRTVRWDAQKEITLEDFKEIMTHYHRSRRHAASRVDQHADSFFEANFKQAA